MYEVLVSMGIKVKLPIECHVNNVSAIFIAENVTATAKFKYIDIREKCFIQFVQDGFLKIVFVKTKENISDIITKNVSTKIHLTFKDKYMEKRRLEVTWLAKQQGRVL